MILEGMAGVTPLAEEVSARLYFPIDFYAAALDKHVRRDFVSGKRGEEIRCGMPSVIKVSAYVREVIQGDGDRALRLGRCRGESERNQDKEDKTYHEVSCK